MQAADEQDSGWRGSPELWIQAAYEALIDQGIDAVRIQTLGARLKLSRTSFYWFFKDRAALLAALADMWEQRTTVPMVEACRAYAETETEAMLNLIGCFLSDRTFDSRLEFAVRGWALQDAAILDRLRVVDAARLEALGQMLERWGHPPQDADVRARTIYLVQIGYISMQTRETLETRLQRVPNYVEIYTGRAPTENEMARARARLEALG
ncbi:TetR/AcrR family transcriptional regulator [Aliigemmobacter aestuarii]|uniref:TetR/AcrR family transcriptional regulator n=1 Tax=Aliigemmobacter aestuarii TaxID=1445661 RepID=A0A4S3MKQ8_9RHOB|nr:TetR/AcrR family transcriptional regulator [Gemmobacter aestuarii]THD82353.1 TetR/AcrR family transcriptional regulator [Gemmobacter aestuarii]